MDDHKVTSETEITDVPEAAESTSRFTLDENGLSTRDDPGRGIPKQDLSRELLEKASKPYDPLTHFGR